MRRRTSPVQQWIDSLPSPAKPTASSLTSIIRQQSVSVESESASIPECTDKQLYSEKENYIRHSNMTVSTPIAVPHYPATHCSHNISRLGRDPSFQSDSSHCSSVESLLELRRADPEAVLFNLGFGGHAGSPQENGSLTRIPKRFLQPSRLKGIAINDFVKHQQETSESLDSTSLGYRGLTGSPYIAPSEIVQKIMQRLREHETHELDTLNCSYGLECYGPQQEGRLSVLSPDNRQYLERPRSKSPDLHSKRMIIGQKSFAFSREGDLIEIVSRNANLAQEDEGAVEQVVPGESTSTHAVTRRTKLHDLRSQPSKENRDSVETVVPFWMNNNNNNNNNNDSYSKDNYRDSTVTLRTSLDDNHNYSATCQGGGEAGRRASEGSCDQSLSEAEEGRRHSDGFVCPTRPSEACLARRKSLKRQAHIPDDEAHDEILLEDKSFRCSHCGKAEEEEEEEEAAAGSGCCYRSSSETCWREMHKVLQKNKKLEEAVNRSRRDMAEIRDMLSNVLTVRMEPGF